SARFADLKSGLLAPIRRGPRTVLWTEEFKMGLGNILYLWLWAFSRRRAGEDAVVRDTPHVRPWADRFPGIAGDLMVSTGEIRFRDRRVRTSNQRFGSDFTEEELDAFASALLAREPLASVLPAHLSDPSSVVVNIRRGDYFNDYRFRGKYSFDQIAYLEAALAGTQQQGEIGQLVIVSDDIPWCQARLSWLSRSGEVSYFTGSDPLGHFATLIGARRLVLTNSTFSYWGAYLSAAHHRDNHHLIWAPRFHARHIDQGRAYQLDPRWSIVEDIPGGWDS
ncbi:MAG: alpha-1,2-fucosyltransferase, partial [Propionibacteriaceae bacterium]|nr:alpha-1,2-fucosyltransferase [Propionibacteriaceae bacterium]